MSFQVPAPQQGISKSTRADSLSSPIRLASMSEPGSISGRGSLAERKSIALGMQLYIAQHLLNFIHDYTSCTYKIPSNVTDMSHDSISTFHISGESPLTQLHSAFDLEKQKYVHLNSFTNICTIIFVFQTERNFIKILHFRHTFFQIEVLRSFYSPSNFRIIQRPTKSKLSL